MIRRPSIYTPYNLILHAAAPPPPPKEKVGGAPPPLYQGLHFLDEVIEPFDVVTTLLRRLSALSFGGIL